MGVIRSPHYTVVYTEDSRLKTKTKTITGGARIFWVLGHSPGTRI